jgi:hypothetical protein
MDRNQALAKLRECAAPDEDGMDVESAHSAADDVLCDLLRALGYTDVVEAWEAVPKWYS